MSVTRRAGPAGTAGRPVVGVGVVAERPDGLIAVGHRVTAGETPTWSLPGGHLESGETPVAAALRELAEETGVVAARGELVGLCVRLDGSGVTLAVHVPVPADAELHVTEPHAADEWRWTGPGTVPEPVFVHTRAVLAVWRDPAAPLAGWDLHGVGPR
ncbi:NUDIX domain-containing protein [Pseudonocardia phyllosphaerae]|uniref:NUDIX domain-containing protein n=1 Tax=Pseudonocardia phyllosphaerae TaxID=3390502 RepID=UPI00397C81F4